MDNFTRAFTIVVGVEGVFSNDPDDPGNWTGHAKGAGVLKGTKYGISAAQYPNVDIANLTLDGAEAIYLPDYWNACSCGALPWPLALLVFDCAINQGQGTARMLLQGALGVKVDGKVGPSTITAAAASTTYHAARFMTARAKRYMLSPIFAANGDGWFARLFTIALKQGG